MINDAYVVEHCTMNIVETISFKEGFLFQPISTIEPNNSSINVHVQSLIFTPIFEAHISKQLPSHHA